MTGPQYRELVGPLGPEQSQALLAWTTQRLEACGATVPQTSRLRRSLALVAAQTPSRLKSRAKARRLYVDSLRTIWEFYCYTRSLNPALRLPPSLVQKLARAHGGSDDPLEDTDRSFVARNTQFELWMTSWFVAGGKQARPGEPDLQILLGNEWVGVAAKRIRASSQIMKRAKAAADQVRRNTGRGFVALALDNYSLARTLRVRAPLSTGQRFFQLYPQIDEVVAYLRHSAPWILGLLCFGHVATWSHAPTSTVRSDHLNNLIILPRTIHERDTLMAYFDTLQATYWQAFRQL